MHKTFLTIIAAVLSILAIFFIYQIKAGDSSRQENSDVVLDNGARLVWQDCWFEAPKGTGCAYLHTAPETKGQASAFKLPVVLFRYQGYNRKNDPILYMAGGPGSGAGLEEQQISNYWLKWIKENNFHRDYIIFDQRGTGLSQPKLTCPEYHQTIRDSMIHSIPTTEKNDKGLSALRNCYTKMKQAKLPVDEVSTLYTAADVHDLMEALDYSQWNLQGVSYSTRLAIVIEQKYPGRIRSMVLDSVYPIQKHFHKEWPALLNASLEKIFSYCDHQRACKRDFGNIETKFWDTVADLKKNPMKFDATGSQLVLSDIIFDDEAFIDFLFDSQYESGGLYDLPAVIDAFSRRSKDELAEYINDYLQSRLKTSVSEVVFRAIECKDNPAVDKAEMFTLYKQYPKLLPYLSTEYDACDIWGNKGETINIKELTKESEVPVLILAGEDDPVTPVDWVYDVLGQYPHSQFFSFPDISHSVMDRKACSVELFKHFVNNPSVRPTADCRDHSLGQGDAIIKNTTVDQSLSL